MELAARADVELGKDLTEVVLDRTRADEQPGADLRVRQPIPGQPGHLRLLNGQRFAGRTGWRAGGLGGALAGGLAGGQQLAAGPLGERLHPHRVQHLIGGTQLLARLAAAPLAAQPLTIEQMRTGQLRAEPGPAKVADRLPEAALGSLALAEQDADPCLDALVGLQVGITAR